MTPNRFDDLEWLVQARNDIQLLMFHVLRGWEEIPSWQRPAVVSASFSLWRAVFLLISREEQGKDGVVDSTARAFLNKLVRTNTIAFSDDLSQREWSSGYYVENAFYRISWLTDQQLQPFAGSPPSTVRESWNEAFRELHRFVTGTVAGTIDADASVDEDDEST